MVTVIYSKGVCVILKYISGRQYLVEPPIPLGMQEQVIASFSIPNVAPTDTVSIEMEIVWEKLSRADLGFMEIHVHQHSAFGPVVYSTDETCYSAATTLLEFEHSGVTTPEPVYVLTASSYSHTAIMKGPVFITCRVFADET